jgi:hypothetical protein
MNILKNGIKSVTHRFFSGRTLKMRDIWNKFGTPGHFIKKWDCPGKNGTNGNPTLDIFRRRSVRISVWTSANLTKVLCGFRQSLQANACTVPRVSHGHFLPNPFLPSDPE